MTISFTTNHGHQLKTDCLDDAISEAIETALTYAGEKAGVPFKVVNTVKYSNPRLNSTGIKVTAVPDLPEFISKLIQNMPEVDLSFSIKETPDHPGDERWQIENPSTYAMPFVYEGDDWRDIADQHMHFIATGHAAKGGTSTETVFLHNVVTHTPGRTNGCIMNGNVVCGSVQARGIKL